MKMNIENIWGRIVLYSGEEFTQIRGKVFTYEAHENYIKLQCTNQNLAKTNFQKSLIHLLFKNTVNLQDLWGPSYIFAILMDDRIRAEDW